MARPTFAPNAVQQRILNALAAEAEIRRASHARTDALIAEAQREDIPINHIAKEADVTRKTVYRHLGKPMK